MKNYLKSAFTMMLLCIIIACSKEKGTKNEEKIIPVKITELIISQTASEKSYIGTVEESVALSLSFSGMGTVEQVYISEGQKVQKGQLLAVLNSATADNSYQLMLAKQQQAQDAYDRLLKIHENGPLPDIKMVEVETGLQQAKLMTAVAKKNLDDCKLYAPWAGVIASRRVESGSSIMPGITAFKLISINKVNVKISIPENEIGSITEGQTAKIVVSALNNAVFTGKIDIKGVAATPLTHTYEANISINNPQLQLMPGMICKVLLSGDADVSEIVVPFHAIQIAADGNKYVWLADDGIAKRRHVKTGNLTNNGIIVTDGLTEGDKLIIEGFQKVSEGSKISINR